MSSKRTIFVCHGIYGHGGGGPDVMIPGLEEMGYEVVNYDYRWTSATTAGIRPLVIKKARDLCLAAERKYHETGRKPDILAHSFGVQLALRSCWAASNQTLWRHLFAFHGAARAGFSWPVGPNSQIQHMWNFYYPKDRALWLTKPLRCIMPWNQMGTLGRDGYTGPRNCSITGMRLAGKPKNSHNGWFFEGREEALNVIRSVK